MQDGDIGTPVEGLPARVFPADSNVYHFHPIAFVEHMKRMIGKEDIDLSDPDKWMSQFDNPIKPKTACYRTSVIVLNNYGVTGAHLGNADTNKKYENDTYYYSNTIQMVIQLKDGTLKGTGREQEGIDYIDSQLESGCPVVVGVDKEKNETYNADNSTEHFFVITGRLTDKDGLYYRFFEVGTYPVNKAYKGISEENKLYIKDDLKLVGEPEYSDVKLTVTQVRKNN